MKARVSTTHSSEVAAHRAAPHREQKAAWYRWVMGSMERAAGRQSSFSQAVGIEQATAILVTLDALPDAQGERKAEKNDETSWAS